MPKVSTSRTGASQARNPHSRANASRGVQESPMGGSLQPVSRSQQRPPTLKLMESTRPDNTASSTASLDNHEFCINTAEALERDKEQMLKRIKKLGQTQQQLRAENQQLLNEQQQLKQQLSDAQASQGQDQGLEDMQRFVQEALTTVSGWQQTLWGYQDASTNAAMASILPDSAAQGLWTDRDGELEFLEDPHCENLGTC